MKHVEIEGWGSDLMQSESAIASRTEIDEESIPKTDYKRVEPGYLWYPVNRKVIDKNLNPATGKPHTNGTALTTGYEEKYGTIHELANDVKKGYAISTGLFGGKRRNKNNVVGTWLILADIDNSRIKKDANGNPIKGEDGKSIKEYTAELPLSDALNHPFIRQYGALIYTSASHKPGWDKYRLVFKLPRFLERIEDIESIIIKLMKDIPGLDISCKDASRAFYGNRTAEFPLLNANAELPESFLQSAFKERDDFMREWEKKKKGKSKTVSTQSKKPQPSSVIEGENDLEMVREALKYIPPRSPGSGNYEECTAVAMAIASEFDYAIALELIEEWSPSIPNSTWDVMQKIKSYKHDKRENRSMGTFWHIAEKYGFYAHKVAKSDENSLPMTEKIAVTMEWVKDLKKLGFRSPSERVKFDEHLNPIGIPRIAILTVLAHRALGDRIKYNEMSTEIEIDSHPANLNLIKQIFAEEINTDVPVVDGLEILVKLAKINTYHPVRIYLEGLPDASDSSILDNLSSRYFGNDSAIANIFMRKIMIAAVKRVFEPGCKHDLVPILVGAQGIRKSTFWSVLAKNFFDDTMQDITNRDELTKINNCWFSELAEVDCLFGQRSNESFKRFISTQCDRYRPAYGRKTESFPRTSIFCGSSNRTDLLSDDTGDRRYLVIEVFTDIDTEKLSHEVDSLWSAAILAYKQGEVAYLSKDEMMLQNANNAQYREIDAWDEPISAYLENKEYVLIRDIAAIALKTEGSEFGGISIEKLDSKIQKRIARILSRLGWMRGKKKKINGMTINPWVPLSGALTVHSDEDIDNGQNHGIYEGRIYTYKKVWRGRAEMWEATSLDGNTKMTTARTIEPLSILSAMNTIDGLLCNPTKLEYFKSDLKKANKSMWDIVAS